jgi:hypothetical protein
MSIRDAGTADIDERGDDTAAQNHVRQAIVAVRNDEIFTIRRVAWSSSTDRVRFVRRAPVEIVSSTRPASVLSRASRSSPRAARRTDTRVCRPVQHTQSGRKRTHDFEPAVDHGAPCR